jgi:integrase
MGHDTMKKSWPTDPRTPQIKWKPDRHGNERVYYFNRDHGGQGPRLRAAWATPAFYAEYDAADAKVRNGLHVKTERVPKLSISTPAPKRLKVGDSESLNYLLDQYYASPEWQDVMSPATRDLRLPIFEKLCQRKTDEGLAGELPFRLINKRMLMRLRDLLKDTPNMANEAIKAISGVFEFAVDREMIEGNPCDDVRRFKRKIVAARPKWEIEHLEKFFRHYPLGTRAHRTITVMLYTGARRSDANLFNDDMVVDAIHEGRHIKKLAFDVVKGEHYREQHGKEKLSVGIPILPALQEALDTRPAGQRHWLVSHFGKPWERRSSITDNVRFWCQEIELPPGLTPHGLRRTACRWALQNGASYEDCMAIFGWETIAMPKLYAEGWEREGRSMRSMHLITLPERPAPVHLEQSKNKA